MHTFARQALPMTWDSPKAIRLRGIGELRWACDWSSKAIAIRFLHVSAVGV